MQKEIKVSLIPFILWYEISGGAGGVCVASADVLQADACVSFDYGSILS